MQGQEEKERDDDEQQKKQVRRAEIDPGRIGGDRSVEEVQEIVDVIDSSAANCVWPIQKNGVVRSKTKKEVKLAPANGSAIRVEGDSKLELCAKASSAARSFWMQTSKDHWHPSARSWTAEARSCLVSKNRTSKTRARSKDFRSSAERSERFEGERKGVGFQEAGVTSDVREFRERDMRKEGCEARRDGVRD